MTALKLPERLQNHRGFARTFQPGKLTLGLIAPFKGYPDSPVPEMDDFATVIKAADQSGIATLWVRDVPFYDPSFGDVAQIYDPSVTLGYLAALTQNVALGSAGYVSPLREPILTAKEAASAEQISGGRFLLGLASGDRPTEYPAFAADFNNRAERYREAWQIIRRLTQEKFPAFNSEHYGRFSGNLDLVPKPAHGLPMLAIGRARQELEWIARESDAWIWYGIAPEKLGDIVNTLKELGDGETWKPFGVSNFVELLEDPNAPAEFYNNIYLRGGAKSIVEFWQKQQADGVAHITVNLQPTRRGALETIQDFAENVIPHFAV